MKGKFATIMIILVAIAVMANNPGELKAQVPGMPSPEFMEFYTQ